MATSTFDRKIEIIEPESIRKLMAVMTKDALKSRSPSIRIRMVNGRGVSAFWRSAYCDQDVCKMKTE